MNTNKTTVTPEAVLASVIKGEKLSRETLRVTARHFKVSQGKTTSDLINNLKAYASTAKVTSKPKKAKTPAGPKGKPGRPKAKPEDLVGYKVKIGLRYAKADGTLVTSMKAGDIFATTEDGQKVVNQLVESKLIRVWGDRVRAQMIPRYAVKAK